MVLFHKITLRSENIGGMVGFAGNLLLLLAGDWLSLGAMLLFLTAEVIRMRFGHRTSGYAFGCGLTALGQSLLLSSGVTTGNLYLQTVLTVLLSLFCLGATRYPLERLGVALGAERMIGLSRMIQPFVGAGALMMRVPILLTAALGGNWIFFVASCMWGVADCMTGRLHNVFDRNWIRRRA